MGGAEDLVSRCIAPCGPEKATLKDYKVAQALFQQPEFQEVLNNAEVLDHLLSGHAEVVEHSLLFFCLLHHKIPRANQKPDLFVQQLVRGLLRPHRRQLRAISGKVRDVVEEFVRIHIEQRRHIAAIQPLQHAISVLSSSPEQLTGIHAQLLKVCLLSKNYHLAMPLLDRDYFEVDARSVRTSDFMTFYYYGGLVCLGLKRFGRACHHFRMVFEIPATVPSMIMVEAYKKYILASLLLRGEPAVLPTTMDSSVRRQLKTSVSVYTQLEQAFRDTPKLQELAQQHEAQYREERNEGLVKQVLRASTEQQILTLTKCYVTLSLADIASATSLASSQEAEEHLLRMIERGQIHAVISLQDGMVHFTQNSSKAPLLEEAHHLHQHILKSMELSRRIEALHTEVTSSTEFLTKQAKTEPAH